MCGIFGAVGVPASGAQLADVHRLLGHRGPDDRGDADVGGCLFVHRRLSIIDLSAAGRQPMRSADGSAWITYNGEIYNYVELRRELEHVYPFKTHTDTEVILAAYQQWGDGCLSRLRGMFAFGLWDQRRSRLMCATDRLSIKPLLYASDGERFVFSSEVKPIAAVGIGLRPDRRMLYQYLRYGLLDHAEDTLFEGVRQLRPGTYLTHEAGRLTVRRYWDLTDEELPWRGDESEEEIAATLQEAVDLHLRGDVEPALSLSSGLDSNVLRALIQRGGRYRDLQCFTYCFSGTPYDECDRVRPIVARAAIRHHTTEVPVDGIMEGLAALVASMEAPVGGLGIYGYWLNSRHVSQRGLKVLLDGQGSDEGFAGYKYYYGQRLGWLASRGERVALETELAAFNAVHGSAIAYPSAAFDTLVRRDDLGSLMKAPDGTSLASDYLTADFVRTFGEDPAPLPRPFADPVKTAMYQDLMFLKIPKLLRFQDRAAMSWSVEVRVPYLDHVLLERLYRTPSRVLLAGGITKALLRGIGARILDSSLEEPKLYVAAPQREWIKGPLAPAISDLIHTSTLAADGYVDADALSRQYAEYRASRDLGNSFFVWKFLNLELWYRAFIRPGTCRPVAVAAS